MFKEELHMCETVTNNKLDKVKELITKLLEVTVENGATENEAVEAALKVQKILAKYDMELADINMSNTEDIITEECNTSNDQWRTILASIIAKNFCTQVFSSGNSIVFYGYKRHCEVAKEVFMSLYNFGRKRATELFKEYRDAGRNVKGLKNQFYIGFVHGVDSALGVQSRELMVITPPEVVESFDNYCAGHGMRTVSRRVSYRRDSNAYDRGVASGRSAASRKELTNG